MRTAFENTRTPNSSSETRRTLSRKLGRRHRPGYVLIMTLVLIAVAALSLATLGRHSLELAGEAVHAQRGLQRYWATKSLRAQVLENAEEIFYRIGERDQRSHRSIPAPSQVAAQFEIADMKLGVQLSDEDAKLNLNSLTMKMPQEQDQLIRHLAGSAVSIQLTTTRGLQPESTERAFFSWGQCIDIPAIVKNNQVPQLWEATSKLTCWGNGKLNIRTVSDETLHAVVREAVSQRVATKLVDARENNPDADWQYLLNSLGLKRRERSALRGWFTDRSNCYCLWLELDDGQRRWYHQWVKGDVDASGVNQTYSFSW